MKPLTINRNKSTRAWITARSSSKTAPITTTLAPAQSSPAPVSIDVIEADQGVRWQDFKVAPEPVKEKPVRMVCGVKAIRFLTQSRDEYGIWQETYVEYSTEWVTSVGINIPALVLTDELKTIPFHRPITGCTVTAFTPGKVLVMLESDPSGFRTALMFMAEKQVKYSKKFGGYPMNYKKFANFIHQVRNSERGN